MRLLQRHKKVAERDGILRKVQMIKKCCCEDSTSPAAAFQNRRYGLGMRVCNEQKEGGYCCTVCGAKHNKVKDKEKK